MSEIDKLVNQAFPDELRDVEPIDVDEDAILSMTLDTLGLEPSQKVELSELIPARRHRPARKGKEQESSGTEFVEVPVVVRRRWMDWVGWAIAACLVLVLAVNWGPWLISNLDFGIGPRSDGEVFLGESSGVNGAVTVEPTLGAHVSVYSVDYGGDAYPGGSTIRITLVITPVAQAKELDMDDFSFELTDGVSGEALTRRSRSNEDNKVTLKYDLDGNRHLLLTVRMSQVLRDEEGHEVGFTYKDVDKLEFNLNTGKAESLLKNSQYDFRPYDPS